MKTIDLNTLANVIGGNGAAGSIGRTILDQLRNPLSPLNPSGPAWPRTEKYPPGSLDLPRRTDIA
jgi:hypothetical protein